MIERTGNTYTKGEVSSLWDLWTNKKWSKNYQEQIECLYNVFGNPKDRKLLNRFLLDFHHVSSEESNTLICSIASKIKGHRNLSHTNTYLIPRDNGSRTDGSHKVLYEVVNALHDYSWEYGNSNNFKEITENMRDNIVVLDDFVGTGKSVIRTINYFRKNLSEVRFSQTSFYLFCIAGMEKSKQNIIDAGYSEVHYEHELLAGMTDLSANPQADRNILIAMQNEVLAKKVGGMKLRDYHCGHGEAEALYFSDGYRIPNSVFPLFWWRKLVNDETDWTPMFRGR